MIFWSGSCFPQNKNNLISFTVAHCIQINLNYKKNTMKFSAAGHSSVKEVDSVHSLIERTLDKTEY